MYLQSKSADSNSLSKVGERIIVAHHFSFREKDMALIEKKKALTKELIKERDDRERMEQLIQAEQRFLKEKVMSPCPA